MIGMKKLSTLLSLVFGIFASYPLAAQQIPVFSQYIYNPSVFNPSYAGQGGKKQIFLAHRQQWMGFEDAPNSTLLSGHMGLGSDQTFGLGGVIIRDNAFVNQRISVNLFPSVHLEPATGHQISFGINLGVVNHSLDFSRLQNSGILSTQVDPLLVGGESTNELHFDTGLGLNYQYEEGNNQIRLGAALSQLSLSSFAFSEGALYTPFTHLLINASARFPINQQVIIEPLLFYKQAMGKLTSENGSTTNSQVAIGGGEMDAMVRVIFPDAANFWFGVGSRVDIGSKEIEGNSRNSSWAFSGAAGVDIGDQLQINFVAEVHQYLPLSLELGLSADLGSLSSSPAGNEVPNPVPQVTSPPVAQVQKEPKKRTPKVKETKVREPQTRKPKPTRQKENTDGCDPLWRHPECLDRELERLAKRPTVAEVLPIIAANEVILIYKFSDNDDPYMLNDWGRISSMISHIQDVLVRLRSGQEPLGTITKMQVTGKIKSSAGLLQTSSKIPYSGEYGGLIEAEILLDGQSESFSIVTGNISRKQQLYLKQLSLAKAFITDIEPEFKVLSSQDIQEDWEFSIEIRISR